MPTLPQPSRDDLATRYIEQLPYAPYPMQEEALLAWFAADQGVMVCAPTGTGKTLIAEAALFEALHTGTTAYYTTPLIALTEQKFREMQAAAHRWGFDPRDVGLVTGNRRENPDARVLVVVAEILFNRLLHTEAFDFSNVSAVVMDEFHSFGDPERGVVWELTLGLLPRHVRTLLLSATVGNAREFLIWLNQAHQRKLELVEGKERKVPLSFEWVGDKLLTEHVEDMAEGEEVNRRTPALIFCFNREECWTVAEQLKGKGLLAPGQQARLTKELEQHDWSKGAGPKLKQLLLRGVGVHHAGVLPKYRRVVEELFQKKLLSVATCTETLSAGINLPARSVVLPSIIKGPPGKKKVLDASSAHQIFGRAGRPQFDNQGYVYVLAHEDDVRIGRWKQQYDQIPEDTKDPGLLRAKKALKRKMPHRRETEQYWNEPQFEKLRLAPPGKLYSRGPLPWRLLAYMLEASPEVALVRRLVGKRLMDSGRLEAAQRDLDAMLMVLWRAGYVTLEPPPPQEGDGDGRMASALAPLPAAEEDKPLDEDDLPAPVPKRGPKPMGKAAPSFGAGIFDVLPAGQAAEEKAAIEGEAAGATDGLPASAGEARVDKPPVAPDGLPAGVGQARVDKPPVATGEARGDKPPVAPSPVAPAARPVVKLVSPPGAKPADAEIPPEPYRPVHAIATGNLRKLLLFKSVDPLYGVFLLNQLGIASREERIQAMESVLELPSSVGHFVRVPRQTELPPGPLAVTRLDPLLLQLGLALPEELSEAAKQEREDQQQGRVFEEDRVWVLTLADKLRRLFEFDYAGVREVRVNPVWAAGELLEFGGDFNKYVTSKSLQKQEGIVFRHLLRLILLIGEFQQFCPPDTTEEEWRGDLQSIADTLTESCCQVDPDSTEKMLERGAATDLEL